MTEADGTLSAGPVVSATGIPRVLRLVGAGAATGAIVGALVVLPIHLHLVLDAAVIRPDLVGIDYDYIGATGPVLTAVYAVVGALVAGVVGAMRGTAALRAGVAAVLAGAASAVALYWFLPQAPWWLDMAIVVLSGAAAAGITAWTQRHPAVARSALRRAGPVLLIGTAAGAVVGCACGLASVFDIRLDADGASRLVEFDPAVGASTFAPDATIGGGTAIGALIGGTMAVATQLLLVSRVGRAGRRRSLTIAGVVPFVGAALAGFTRARIEDFGGPYLVTRATGTFADIGSSDSSPLWPQSILVGLEWGSVAAAVGVIVIARSLALPRPARNTLPLLLWGAVGGVAAAVLFGAIDAGSIVLDVVWYPDPDDPGLEHVFFPSPAGVGILAIGTFALGLVLAQCVRTVLAACPSSATTCRLVAFGVPTFAIAVLPFLHLAFFSDDDPIGVGPSTLLALPVIAAEVVIVLLLARPRPEQASD